MTWSRFLRLSGEGLWVIGGQAAAVIGALVLVRVLTEHLDPAEYGELALSLTGAGLINQALLGGVTAGIVRYYSVAAEQSGLGGYASASRRLILYSASIVGLLAAIAAGSLFLLGLAQWIMPAVLALIFALVSGVSAILSGIQNAARQRAVVALNMSTDVWLRLPLCVVAVALFGPSASAVLFGYALSSLIVIGMQLHFLGRSRLLSGAADEKARDWIPPIVSYSWPICLFGLFTWMQQASDRWAIQTFLSTEDVGRYSVAFQLGYTPIGLIVGVLVAFVSPVLYQWSGAAIDEQRNYRVHITAWMLAGFGVCITILAFLLAISSHEMVFSFATGPEYRSESYLLPWMILAGGIFSAAQVLALKLMSEMRSAAMTVAKIVTALLGAILNVYGAWQFGLHGLVVGLVAFSVAYFLWMAWLSRQPPAISPTARGEIVTQAT